MTAERPYVKAVMAIFNSEWTPGSGEWVKDRTAHLKANGLDETGEPFDKYQSIAWELVRLWDTGIRPQIHTGCHREEQDFAELVKKARNLVS